MIAPYRGSTSGSGEQQRPTVITGIESMLKAFETRPDVDNELGVMLSLARKLAHEYGKIPIQQVLELEQRYESLRAPYEQAGEVPFRFPVQGPELRLVLDVLHEQTTL